MHDLAQAQPAEQGLVHRTVVFARHASLAILAVPRDCDTVPAGDDRNIVFANFEAIIDDRVVQTKI